MELLDIFDLESSISRRLDVQNIKASKSQVQEPQEYPPSRKLPNENHQNPKTPETLLSRMIG